MAIALEGGSTHQTPVNTTEDLTLPGTPVEDDYIRINTTCDFEIQGITGVIGQGWTELFNSGDAGPGSQDLGKRMGSTPDTVVEVVAGTEGTDTNTSNNIATCIQTFSGVDTTTAEDMAIQSASNSTGMPDPPSATTVTANALRIISGHLDDESDADFPIGAPSGYSDDLIFIEGATGANRCIAMMASKLQVSAGAEDPGAFTSSTADDSWRATHGAIRPVAGAGPFTATGAQTLGKISQAGTGRAEAEGLGAQTLGKISQVGSAIQDFIGSAAQELGKISQAGTGRAEAEGAAAQTLGKISQVGTGLHSEGHTATGAQTLGLISQAGSAVQKFLATAAQTLGKISQAGTGQSISPSGTAAQTLGLISQAGAGVQKFLATAAQTLGLISQSGTGVMQPSGLGAQTLGLISQVGTGIFGSVTATAAQTLGLISQAGIGAMEAIATAAQTLGLISQVGTAQSAITATSTGAQTLPFITQLGTGAVVRIGVNEFPGVVPIEADPDDVAIVRSIRSALVVMNNLLLGKMNNSGAVVLTPGAATTVIIDERMTINSVLYFDPMTVNAAGELVAGTMYVLKTDRRNGTFTITHANNSETDRAFRYEIKG